MPSGKLRPGLDRGVVGDDQDVAPVDLRNPGHDAAPGRPAPLGVHAEGRPQADLEERAPWIAQRRDPFPRRQLSLRALAGLRLGSAPLAQQRFVGGQPCDLGGPVLMPASKRLVDLEAGWDGRQSAISSEAGRLYGPRTRCLRDRPDSVL